MSFIDCIKGKVEQKLIKQAQADALQKKYDGLKERYSKTMGNEKAAAIAAERIVNVEAEKIAQKTRNSYANALAQKRIYDVATDAIKKKKAVYDKLKPWQQAFWPKPTADKEIGALLDSAYYRSQSVQREHLIKAADFIEQYASKAFGLKQKTVGMKDVVSAVLGDTVADSSLAKLGKDLRSVFDSLHQRYTAAGGILGRIDNYFPQVHMAGKIKAVTKEEWANTIRPLLDRNKMINPSTGLPYTDNELSGFLSQSYDEIVTNGLADMEAQISEGVAVGRREIASRQDYRRSIRFKDAASFHTYNDKFGVGEEGLYGAIQGYISVMSREIGIMEMISPNANAAMKFADSFMESQKVSKTKRNLVKGMYDILSGGLAGTGEESFMYKAVMGYQNLHRAAVLGSAPISTITDSTFAYMTAKANGLSGVKAFGNWLKGINPANAADRRQIQRMLFVSESSLGSGFQSARMAEDASGGGTFVNTTRAISGVTHRASGLAFITEASKNSVALELAGTMAEHQISKTAWADIKPELQAAMIENGINEAEYKIMMKAKPTEFEGGATFMRPEDILALDGDPKELRHIASLYGDWMTKIRLITANEPTLQTRAITTGAAIGDAQAGTFLRAAASSMFMYKGFSITMFNNFLRPAIAQAAVGKAGNLGVMMVGGTVMGAVAYQLKELLKGRDPHDMTTPRFWKAAMLQGGGLGFYGDFVFKEFNGYGRNLQTELMGPVAATVDDVRKVLQGNFDKAVDDKKESRFFADLANIAYQHIPAQSLWYSRLLAERYIKDTINRMADSNFDRKIRKTEKRLEKETGQGYWFSRGDYAPERLPKMSDAQ